MGGRHGVRMLGMFVSSEYKRKQLVYFKKHSSILIFQTLEKQEVDRVEFTKKQIMLYVFLRKEVNEICEKVTVLKFVAFLNSYCSSYMKAIIQLYRELNF